MPIVGGLDIHRAQINFDYVDLRTGQETREVIRPATRAEFRLWLGQFGRKQAAFAMEGTTGWRFVVEELEAACMEAHLAEPAETRARRGPKRRAKTDRADARLLRDLLLTDNLPESWIPPAHLADFRTAVRLRMALVDNRSAWIRHIQAQVFYHGLPTAPHLPTLAGREYVLSVDLPPTSRQVVEVGCRMLEVFDDEVGVLVPELEAFAEVQPGCQVLQRQWGIGPILSASILAELGDTRRFSSSRQSVRFASLDVTVEESDGKRTRGHLSRQGSPVLRWALYEAAGAAWRKASPDHEYYLEVKDRLWPSGHGSRWLDASCVACTTTWRMPATRPSPRRPELGAATPNFNDHLRPAPLCARRPPSRRTSPARTGGRNLACGNPTTHHVAGLITRAPR